MSKARDLADLAKNANDRLDTVATSAGALSNRNMVTNGAMAVAQRGTSNALTSGNFTLDRFKTQYSALDELAGTVTQDSDAPSGFGSSLKLTTTTAETSIAADEYFYLSQFIEAQNLQQLEFGNSSAKSITLSFWVKSSVTGVFAIGLYTPDNAGMANSTYTISAASTWEKKSLTFTGDTSRAINDDNGLGMYVNFNLAAGTDFASDTTDGAFEAYSDAKWAGGHVQNGVITTANATFQITGVQLEVGDTATPFEHRSYGDELARCQRYYYETGAQALSLANATISGYSFRAPRYTQLSHPVTMRAVPTAGRTIVQQQLTGGTTFAVDETFIGVKATNYGGDIPSGNYSYGGATLDAEL